MAAGIGEGARWSGVQLRGRHGKIYSAPLVTAEAMLVQEVRGRNS